MEEKVNPTNSPETVILTIKFLAGGKVEVSGPIKNEMLSFYMLEKAKDSIKEYNKPKIIPARHGILDFARS